MKTLLTPLSEMAEYEEAKSKIKREKGIVELNGCADSQKLHVVYGLSGDYRNKIIVTYSEQRAKELSEDYSFYDRDTAVTVRGTLSFTRPMYTETFLRSSVWQPLNR